MSNMRRQEEVNQINGRIHDIEIEMTTLRERRLLLDIETNHVAIKENSLLRETLNLQKRLQELTNGKD